MNILSTEENKIEIVQQGAVTSLLKLTRVHDPRVQRNAAGALLNLTHIGWSVIFTLRKGRKVVGYTCDVTQSYRCISDFFTRHSVGFCMCSLSVKSGV